MSIVLTLNKMCSQRYQVPQFYWRENRNFTLLVHYAFLESHPSETNRRQRIADDILMQKRCNCTVVGKDQKKSEISWVIFLAIFGFALSKQVI